MLCKCGCGQEVSAQKMGRPGAYSSGACRVRSYRQQKHAAVTKVEDAPTVVTKLPEIKPILKYPGSKWTLAPWIVSHFPQHAHYIEPYCGSAAVFFAKPPERHEVLNDLDLHIVNLFRVMRTRCEELARAIMLSPWSEYEYNQLERNLSDGDDVEQARRFVVRSWQAHGGTIAQTSGWKHNGLKGNVYPARLWKQIPERLMVAAERLQNAEIRCKPALEIIDYYNTPECLLYIDPPYELSTRARKYYAHEMDTQDHRELLEVLAGHKGSIVLSGYAHPLYDEVLRDWQRVEMSAVTEHGNIRTECLWLNRKASRSQQGRLFDIG
jgi:DNA adenine methylase